MNEYVRKCPDCRKDLKYMYKSHCNRAEVKKSICLECQQNKNKLIDKFIRKCPDCRKNIKYKEKSSYERNVIKNGLCLSCNYKKCGYEDKTNIRNCPTCKKIIIYSNKYKCNYANLKNSECKSCAKIGEKAPLYGRIGERNHNFGKTLSDERKKINSLAMTGEKNHRYGKPPYNIGIPMSDDIRKKVRLSRIKQIEERYGQVFPNYNPKGCQIFNKLMEETNTFIQHAENGGEHYIKELGYWVDGYDEKNNVVYEYDEKHHFDVYGNLKEKDMRREEQIKDFLKCKIIRIDDNKG